MLSPDRERKRRYERKHPEQEAARKRRWREKQRSASHGKTRAELYAVLEQQGGCCAICGGVRHGGRVILDDRSQGQGWHGDHDHKTNTFRGVLCRACNVGLGCFKDNIKTLNAAIRYLEVHAAKLAALKALL